MDQPLFLTDGTDYCSSSAPAIRLSKDHVFLDPSSRQHQLLMELTFIDVDHLLSSFHQLCNLRYSIKLLLSDLFLLLHLTTVGILRLAISDLVPLVYISHSHQRDLDPKLLLNQDGSLVK
jgi:hypothetical protein